ncbi:unnamed protein product [Rotaria sp. Silwood1]|nr:unnamed protein product [Rotaria sp. Silwood1]CAF1069917.1 unnamed protein product [Rotaria sp. Silwood1]CAF4650833.1 unnamed protein product [Rotaria sp. Silwood1]
MYKQFQDQFRLPWNGSVLDYRMMPYVGNGHVATVVFSDFIYMNGLYNGENGTSHRARIPSTLNWQFLIHPSSSSFTLNVSSASNERHPDQVWSTHASLWNDIWANGRIEVNGDDELQRQINAAYYYILSSIPPLSTRSEHKQFYGLSPGSLSRGGLVFKDYAGHSFWDTETWILAKEILSYRIALGDSAAENARLLGYEGWRFPWESARTGVDVTPDGYLDIALYQHHITGDIAFAARQYIAATGDQRWLISEHGGDLIYEIARLWASRVVYSNEKKQYEILTVLPPDEDARPFKNNSVFTNAVASYSIQLADRVSCITRKSVPQTWLDIAFNLYFPFDNATQTHLEYDGFDLKNTIIKQADVVLLGFPLMWPMSKEIRRNDLLSYEPLTRDTGPAMTWSMHTIGFLELNEFEKARQMFRRAYEIYVRPPFNVWTEAQDGIGAVNFITGAGGFLQAILFGYGGIRLTLDQLEVMPPSCLPNQAKKLIFHGLKYHGAILDLTIENQRYHLDIRIMNNNNSMPLVYEYEQQQVPLTNNTRLSYQIGTRLIIRPSIRLCA